MTRRSTTCLEDNLLDLAGGVLRRDLGRVKDDLGECLEDGSTGGYNRGTRGGCIPVALSLIHKLESDLHGRGTRSAYVFVVNDHLFALVHIDAICRPNPPFPEHAVNPRKANLFPIRLANLDPNCLCGP